MTLPYPGEGVLDRRGVLRLPDLSAQRLVPRPPDTTLSMQSDIAALDEKQRFEDHSLRGTALCPNGSLLEASAAAKGPADAPGTAERIDG
jgi:hypothetical protein